MTDRRLLMSTLPTAEGPNARSRARVLCLTLVCHPDPSRIGERSVLAPLLVREAVQLSRGETLFAHPGEQRARGLLDPYLSRNAVTIAPGPEPLSVILSGLPPKAQLDGRGVHDGCALSGPAVESGVLLQLSHRIVLLLHATAAEQSREIDGILGHSDAIERSRRQIARVAELDAHVLIRGASGVGKERVAQSLHARSRRSPRPLVSVNMATLSEGTAVATLFGYARGAFTGASQRHHGLFERADGGTLFLDEVADAPQSVQPMLLRVLETATIQPIGDEQERRVDVRVIAATEQDLDSGPQANGFRSALRHRLAGYEIVVPSLRERLDDIPRLFVHFLRTELRRLGQERLLESDEMQPNPPLQAPLMTRLLQRAFPGNVRELANVTRRLAIDAVEDGVFELDDGPARPPSAAAPDADSATGETTAIDETTLLDALERNAFSPLRAAMELGVPQSTIQFWMRRAGIRRAADLDRSEIEAAQTRCNGDLHAMAKELKVSARALKLALRGK